MEENILKIYNAYKYVYDVVNNVIVPPKELDLAKFNSSTFDLNLLEKSKECIIFEESLITKLKSIYNNFNNVTRSIAAKDKLYFISTTKFPRTHLGLYSDLKRVIKADKCDKIVIPDSLNFSDMGPHIKLDDKNYIYFSRYCYEQYLRTHQIVDTENNFKTFCVFCFPSMDINTIIINNPYKTNISEEELNLIVNNDTKLIKGNHITKYISGNLQTMSFEEYETLNDMLSSEDKSVINMAIKMLGNYNIDKNSEDSSGIYIGLMLYNNRHNMWRASKTTVFKYIEDTLGIHVNKIPRYGEELYLYKIKEFSKNEEQKEYITNIIQEYEKNQN